MSKKNKNKSGFNKIQAKASEIKASVDQPTTQNTESEGRTMTAKQKLAELEAAEASASVNPPAESKSEESNETQTPESPVDQPQTPSVETPSAESTPTSENQPASETVETPIADQPTETPTESAPVVESDAPSADLTEASAEVKTESTDGANTEAIAESEASTDQTPTVDPVETSAESTETQKTESTVESEAEAESTPTGNSSASENPPTESNQGEASASIAPAIATTPPSRPMPDASKLAESAKIVTPPTPPANPRVESASDNAVIDVPANQTPIVESGKSQNTEAESVPVATDQTSDSDEFKRYVAKLIKESKSDVQTWFASNKTMLQTSIKALDGETPIAVFLGADDEDKLSDEIFDPTELSDPIHQMRLAIITASLRKLIDVKGDAAFAISLIGINANGNGNGTMLFNRIANFAVGGKSDPLEKLERFNKIPRELLERKAQLDREIAMAMLGVAESAPANVPSEESGKLSAAEKAKRAAERMGMVSAKPKLIGSSAVKKDESIQNQNRPKSDPDNGYDPTAALKTAMEGKPESLSIK